MDEVEQPWVCACCGASDGQVFKDVTRRLHTVEIMSKFVAPRDEETSIVLCTVCISRMPFSIGPLIEEVNTYVDRNSADDAMLTAFVTRFITEVWPEDEPPSTMLLVKLLNAVGLTTPRGGKWEYHNLNQRMAKLGIDKDAIIRGRVKATFYERIQRLMASASQWAAAKYEGTPVAPEARAEQDKTPLDGWSPPEPVGMPADMPGMEAAAAK